MKTSTLLTIFVLLPAADAGPIDANLSHCDGGFSDRIVETYSSSADATTPQLQLAERHGGSGSARKNTAKDFKEALPLNLRVPTLRQLLRSAKSGQPYAQTELGWRYCKGIGVERDDGKAFEWFSKAAEQGYPQAEHAIGSMYGNGRAVERDLAKAVDWYTRSAQQGYWPAMSRIGLMHESGIGLELDYAKALGWYLRAAEQDFAEAQYAIGLMFENGVGVERHYATAIGGYIQAAEQGHSAAQHKADNQDWENN